MHSLSTLKGNIHFRETVNKCERKIFSAQWENESATFVLRKRLFYLPKEALSHAKRGSFKTPPSNT